MCLIGVIGCKIHFTSCLNITVLAVCSYPSYNDKNPLSVFLNPYFKSSFSNQAVLRVLSEWCSSVQAPPTRVDWQVCVTLAPPPWVSASGAGKTRCLWLRDWGVLLLDVIMNIAVVIYSRHLSRWRRGGLRYFSFEVNPLIPDLRLCSRESFVISFIYRRSEYKDVLWIFVNHLS